MKCDAIIFSIYSAYWQYVITTSDYNTEIKLWNCSLWECMQTINIVATIPPPVQPGKFIAGLDRSASYLVISSLDSLAVYVMQISSSAGAGKNNSITNQSSDSDDSENGSLNGGICGGVGNDAVVRIQNIAEFKLSSGILSFSIVDACMRRLKSTNESYYPFEEPDDEYDDENNATTDALVVHMFVVQGKSLQECQIIYQPCVAEKSDGSLNSSGNTTTNTTSTSSSSNKRSLTPVDSGLLHTNDVKQESSSPHNSSSGSSNQVPLDALFAKSKRNSASSSSASVVAVAVAAAAAPSAILKEAATSNKSRSASPQYGSAYPQLNLMTPDAFNASGSATAVLLSTTTTNSSTTGSDTVNTTAVATSAVTDHSAINSQVMNTLRMLATVTAKGADTANTSLLNLMNNTLIEDREQQKLKEKLEARKKFIAIDRNPERKTAENLASGGSSPSREVQEIMATQDDADDYEPELENLESDEENNYFILQAGKK